MLDVPMKTDFDLAVVGSGFGGSLLAMIARRLGMSVLLIERGKHPRFAIGESTSPLTNLILEQIARKYDLPRLLPFATFGAWKRAYPEIGVGLKRGFTYYKHEAGREFQTRLDRSNELLVAASPADEIADTHWFRADFDRFLMEEAVALGVEYTDETEAVLDDLTAGGAKLTLTRGGQSLRASCRLLIDATGPKGFLHRSLGLPEREFDDFPQTQTLFSHFTGVARTDEMPQFHSDERPPYAPDDAALHHVFDDGWMWVLRFGNGITSAGISMTGRTAAELNLADRESAWHRFLALYPTVGAQFVASQPVREFTYAPKLAFRSAAAAGEAWAMLPSAAAFVDPLFSTGIPLTLVGIERLGQILEDGLAVPELPDRLRDYGELTLSDADWSARFVGGCFAAMPHFELFTAFSMYYFAAVSFSEMARRIERRDLASRFLALHRREYADGLRAGASWLHNRKAAPSPSEIEAFRADIADAVQSINIAGVCDSRKRNWYDIDFNDVIENAHCLEMTPDAMRSLLANADWASPMFCGSLRSQE
jgi:FADH2 O2-dependent halogenase